MAGQRRETGQYEVDSSAGFLGFSRGIIVDIFQIAGIVLVAVEILKRSVRYCNPLSPKYLRCRVEILSGPRALEGLAFYIAAFVSSRVNCWAPSSDFFLKVLVVFLAVLELLCLITDEYCLLNSLEILFG